MSEAVQAAMSEILLVLSSSLMWTKNRCLSHSILLAVIELFENVKAFHNGRYVVNSSATTLQKHARIYHDLRA